MISIRVQSLPGCQLSLTRALRGTQACETGSLRRGAPKRAVNHVNLRVPVCQVSERFYRAKPRRRRFSSPLLQSCSCIPSVALGWVCGAGPTQPSWHGAGCPCLGARLCSGHFMVLSCPRYSCWGCGWSDKASSISCTAAVWPSVAGTVSRGMW